MKKLILATGNAGKARELRALMAHLPVEILTLKDLDDLPPIIEDGDSFEANAAIKAELIARHTGLPTIADDSGLCVDALDGAPGIYSARFAGAAHDDAKNNALLLERLAGIPYEKRTAHFVCVIAMVRPGEAPVFSRGEVQGHILEAPRGEGGFGYDPLFFVDELGQGMAELSAEAKNKISHRGRAYAKALPLLEALIR